MSTRTQEGVLSTPITIGILFVNSLREARNYFRHSARAWIWVAFVILLVLILGANASVPLRQDVALKLVDAVTPGAFWFSLGALGMLAVSHPPVQFVRRADAFLLPLSHLSRRGVVLWFTVRNLARWVLRIAVPAVILVSDVFRSDSLVVVVDLVCLALLVQIGRLFASLVGNRRPRVVSGFFSLVALAGLGMIAVALIGVLRTGSSLATVVVREQPIPPGNWLVWSTAGNALGVALLVGVGFVALAGMLWLSGADIYPEMWMNAQRRFRFQESVSRGSFDRLNEGTRSVRLRLPSAGKFRRVPSGALVLAWKEGVTTSRARRHGGVLLVLRGPFSAIIGIAVGEYLMRNPRSQFLASDLFGIATYLVVFSGLPAAQRLAADMGRPLWWISEASLSRRLAVVTVWGALVATWTLAPAAVAIVAFIGRAGVAVALVPAIFSVMWTFRSVALWVLTVFPTPAEVRGPAQIFKGLISLTQLGLLAIIFGVSASLTHSTVAGVLVMSVVAVALGVMGVVLSARRIRGNGATFSRRTVLS